MKTALPVARKFLYIINQKNRFSLTFDSDNKTIFDSIARCSFTWAMDFFILNHKKILITFLFFCTAFACINIKAQTAKQAGDYIENMSYNTGKRASVRSLQYRPQGEDFVCINGNNRFTRALYGSHTLFRLETSDRPVFATYSKNINKHIAFKIKTGEKIVALDSFEYCKSIYKPGRRDYELKDAAIGNGILRVSAQAFYDKDGAIWKFDAENLPENTKLVCLISEIKDAKLNRNGDMGADPPDAFEAPKNPKQLKIFEADLKQQSCYVVFENSELSPVDNSTGENLYNEAETARLKIAGRLKINTPDPYLNTLGGVIAMAADGIWDGEVWLHGAIGWRMSLPGWRAAYAGDAIGWHDRARIHFDNYAASQVTDVEPVYPHPQQDSTLNLARALKKWGTPMYSNGYICRNPRNNNQMNHYDMNLAYIDALLWHLLWTGDLEYARKIFPVIKLSLEWEKRNFDPDNDGLYEAYAATWASDGLMYNSGGTTVGSAYNYRANKIAAEIAALIGEDPAPYRNESEKILQAMNHKLWLNDKGWWAEYIDFMGNKMIHPNAALASVYTAIDSEAGDIFQAYQATRYVDEYIPHIPVIFNDMPENEHFSVVSTSNWMPYVWSLNNVAFAETAHTALAYWEAGRPDEALNLFKSAVLDGMYLGNSPANIGQLSYYDAARGECYRDFGDPIGVYSRAIVQGLFGIFPDALRGKLTIRPGFPAGWNFAEIQHPDIDYKFERNGDKDFYNIINKFDKQLEINLLIYAPKDSILSMKVNGKNVKWNLKDGINAPLIEIPCGFAEKYLIEIEWGGKVIATTSPFEKFFIKQQQDFSENIPVSFDKPEKGEYVQVDIDTVLNASVTDIFKNRYMSPRSPYTTMETPVQGVGEWCHPLLTYNIDDAGFRAAIKNETFETPFGVPFRTPSSGNNIAFTTLWDNYPDSISCALSGKAQYAFLLMAGTTNAMQYDVTNGTVSIYYTDGTKSDLVLQNPETWCPIEQDFYTDGLAFKINAPRPYRVAFKTGIVTRDMETAMKINPLEVYGREIKGGAGVILGIPLDNKKELRSIRWKAVANEVIIGVMAVTLLK